MPVEINDSDELARCIIFDRAFDDNVHTDELLWRFEQTRDDGASHESAVLRRLAPASEDVHEIGCGIAASQNERKGQPEPGPKRRYYCGFRSASVASLPREGNGYTIEYSNVPEGGVEAHVDVALYITVEGKNAKAQRRTDAGLALAECFGPPEPHVCECDSNDELHPVKAHGEACLISGLRDRWPSFRLGDPPSASNDDDPGADLLDVGFDSQQPQVNPEDLA